MAVLWFANSCSCGRLDNISNTIVTLHIALIWRARLVLWSLSRCIYICHGASIVCRGRSISSQAGQASERYMYMYIHVYIYTHTHIYIYIYTYVYVWTHMYMNMYTYTYGYTYMYMPGVERRIYTYTSHWYMYIKSSPKVACTYNLLQKRHIHTILSKRDLLCSQHLSHAHIIRHLMTMYIQSSPKETHNLLQKRHTILFKTDLLC